ncbi:uncharacterized protein LOC110105940 [Dendrobium catenatum]|uniref:uncharacterized protein LOC110105940 n=1 Tax=Dendrobium catenatum TaxID=906689 RepID=UPI0010A06C5C|nr:uncharacterized protein LOC110105940 [Dendrobium catenatum]
MADGDVKTLSPLLLSDFYFAPSKEKGQNMNKKHPSASVLKIDHGNEMQIDDSPILNENSCEETLNIKEIDLPKPAIQEEVESEPLLESDFPQINFQGNPILIEFSDSDSLSGNDDPTPMVCVDTALVCPPEDIEQSEFPLIPPGFESVIPKVDYNVLAHLRKLPAKLSIYDTLLLSKEMRESLIKALLDPEICLTQLAATSEDKALYFKEVPGVTFSDEDMLLRTADHNRPLYITVDVGNFKLVLRGFNEQGERALGSITLLLVIAGLKTEAKFHIIDSATSFNALLEIGIYEDATYFVPKGSSSRSKLEIRIEEKLIGQSSNQMKEKGKHIEQEMTQLSSEDDSDIVILRPPNALPQRDSDVEFTDQGVTFSLHYKNTNTSPKFDLTLNDDSDIEEDVAKVKSDEPELTMYEKLSRRIEALSLTPLSAGRIAGLEVKVAPNLNGKVKKVQKFFPGSSSTRDEGDVTFEETDFNELMELPFGYFPVCVKNTFSKGSVLYRWTKGQARYHENIWKTKIKNNPTSGLCFGTVNSFDDDEYCLMITYHLESPNVPTDPFCPLDGLCLETLDDPDDLQVRDAPSEFEEEIKLTVDELKEINLGTDDDPRPIFISALLREGLPAEVAVHKLGIRHDAIPVKQASRRMRLEIEQQVVSEVKKLAEAGFIREE